MTVRYINVHLLLLLLLLLNQHEKRLKAAVYGHIWLVGLWRRNENCRILVAYYLSLLM